MDLLQNALTARGINLNNVIDARTHQGGAAIGTAHTKGLQGFMFDTQTGEVTEFLLTMSLGSAASKQVVLHNLSATGHPSPQGGSQGGSLCCIII